MPLSPKGGKTLSSQKEMYVKLGRTGKWKQRIHTNCFQLVKILDLKNTEKYNQMLPPCQICKLYDGHPFSLASFTKTYEHMGPHSLLCILRSAWSLYSLKWWHCLLAIMLLGINQRYRTVSFTALRYLYFFKKIAPDFCILETCLLGP